MNLSKFVISDTQYLQINPECIHDDECEFCLKIDIDYIDEKNKICIRFGYDMLSSFCYFISESGYIQKLLNIKMVIDSNITNDLGFDWNQFFQRIIKDTDVDEYLCWSNSHKQVRPYYNSWMYNDKDGNIIFEITPFYPWFGETKKSHPDFITYKQFMKNYKPTVKTVVPKENIEKWIDQARQLKKMYIKES